MYANILLLTPPGSNVNPIVSMLPWVLIMVVFYFFMIRPQMKRQKDAKKFRENLKVGDKVVTIGGAHGIIRNISDTTIVLEVEGGRIRYEKSAISSESKTELGQQNA